MNFCPKNAHHFNHKMTPDQAREWCRTTNCNRDRKGCDYEFRWVEKVNARQSLNTEKPKQGRLF